MLQNEENQMSEQPTELAAYLWYETISVWWVFLGHKDAYINSQVAIREADFKDNSFEITFSILSFLNASLIIYHCTMWQ